MAGLFIPSFAQGYAPRDGPPAHPELHQGLIGHWAPSLGKQGKYLADVSVNHNTGVLTNFADINGAYVPGPPQGGGWALDFDRSLDQHVLVPNSPKLFSMSQLSLVVWAKSRGEQIGGNEYNLVDAWNTDDLNYLLRGDNVNEIEFFTFTSSSAGGGFSDLVIDDSELHLIVATYDGAIMRMYVDVVESATTYAQTGTVSEVGNTDISIGGQLAFANDFWDGQIFSTSIYDRALVLSEIQLIYHTWGNALFQPAPPVYPAAVAGAAPTDGVARMIFLTGAA